jgi:hypothetical protein
MSMLRIALGVRFILLPGYFFDRELRQFLTHPFDLGVSPSAMVDTGLQTMLNDEPPALLLGTACVPLQTNDKLLELIPA